MTEAYDSHDNVQCTGQNGVCEGQCHYFTCKRLHNYKSSVRQGLAV